MGVFPGGKGTKSQIPFQCKAAISSNIAWRQPGCDMASPGVLGTKTEEKPETKAL